MKKMLEAIKAKKILSLLLAFVLVFSVIPFVNTPVMAAEDDTRVVDASTIDGWKTYFGPDKLTTEFAGGVWTDKSVFKNRPAGFPSSITLKGNDNRSFLVALSTIASNMTVTGKASAPIDMMIILDLSGSMVKYNQGSGYNSTTVRPMQELVAATNESITTLMASNPNNRVGVVLFSGTSSSSTNSDAAVVLLPLNRYETDNAGSYLTYTDYDSWSRDGEWVEIDDTVTYENSNTKPSGSGKEVVGATYIQPAINLAMDALISDSNEVTVNGVNRLPVMVFMSDGSPTLSTTNFTDPGQYNLGNGQASSTSAAQGFVTQLTAAYAKAKISEKYNEDLLFYTLGYKIDEGSVAECVLDPSKSLTAINDFWALYDAAAVGGTVAIESETNRNVNSKYAGLDEREAAYAVIEELYGEYSWSNRQYYQNWRNYVPEDYYVTETVVTKSVTKIETALEQNYVDKYFSTSDDLSGVFDEIVTEALLQAKYHPTLVSGDEDMSGYVSFVDRVGEYMNVTDIKGILIGDVLYTGENVAANIVNGGLLGTTGRPTALGQELIAAVMERMGIEDEADAIDLVELAMASGQLSSSAQGYSNYIGWYANKAGEYLGFYNDGNTVLPDATGNADTDPYYTVKSYGYLGAANGTDMMHIVVQVRTVIATGEEIVTFAVPASLIPVITYDVELDEDGNLVDLTATSAVPIRLVYEVALDGRINEITVNDPTVVSAEYLAAHTDANTGAVYFYTNEYEADNSTGYNTVNTYAYFNPSRENDRYYYTEDSLIYTDTNGTVYEGATAPDKNGTYYRAISVYAKNGSFAAKTVYEKISARSLTHIKNEGGKWYVRKGTVHTMVEDFSTVKVDPQTGTLPWSDKVFVDTEGHDDETGTGYMFYVGATLGNNGRLSVTPATGIMIEKEVQTANASASSDVFTFTVIGSSADASQTYKAYKKTAAGVYEDTTVTFDSSGKTTVSLKGGEQMYIVGLHHGEVYEITETETVDYKLVSINGNTNAASAVVTVSGNKIEAVKFVNTARGKGNFTLTKEVDHEFNSDPVAMAEKSFVFTVTLSGIGTESATFAAEKQTQDGTVTELSIPMVNGMFMFGLKHNESLELFGLPEGTIVTVVEEASSITDGFNATYYDDGVLGDGEVLIEANETSSVIVINSYRAESAELNLNVKAEKIYINQHDEPVTDWQGEGFDFVLEIRKDGAWHTVDTVTATQNERAKVFDLSSVDFPTVGAYSFRVLEVKGNNGKILYSAVYHTFTVTVTDEDMNGKLEITKVHSEHADKDFEKNPAGNYEVNVSFTNTLYQDTTPVITEIGFAKELTNPSGSTLVGKNGFVFGLYTDENCTVPAVICNDYTFESSSTDGVGEAFIDITFFTAGDYTFYVKEIEPASKPAGMTYSQRVVKLDIAVTGTTALSADVTYTTVKDDAGNASDQSSLDTDGRIVITNTYDIGTAQLTLNATKELYGRDMKENEVFTFELRRYVDGVNDLLAATGSVSGIKNGESKAITFTEVDGGLTFNEIGSYFFYLVETTPGGNGLTTDSTAFYIRVDVTDEGGELKAAYTVLNTGHNNVIFRNYYEAKETSVTIEGNKVLEGRRLINDEFTFILTEVDKDGNAIENGIVLETKNFLDGSFRFAPVSFNSEAVKYFVISEKQENGVTGIKFDKSTFKVTVTVTDNGNGQLVADVDYEKKVEFVNVYAPVSGGVTVTGTKILENKTLNAGDFTFELYSANDKWEYNADGLIQSVTNAADGTFIFTNFGEKENGWIYTKAGSYNYVIVEKNGGKTIDDITYDSSVYHVTVEVTDNKLGTLVTTVHVSMKAGEDSVPKLAPEFVNTYTEPEQPPVIPDNPATSDALSLALMTAGAAVVIATVAVSKKKRRED